jgi:voltage-gated potassium channel
MAQNLTVAVLLVGVSVLVQVGVTSLALGLFPRLALLVERRPGYWMRFGALAGLIFLILLGNLALVHIWGFAFYLLDYFDNFWDAQHFAAETFTTLGYGDILLPPERRSLAGWLALTGLLMVGWSTALFAYLITKYRDAHEASDGPSPHPLGDRKEAPGAGGGPGARSDLPRKTRAARGASAAPPET